MVAEAYCGYEKYKISSIEQTEQATMGLLKSITCGIKAVANLEEREICLNNYHFNKFRARSIDKMMRLGDCRSFAKFLYTSSRKSTTTFINGDKAHEDNAQNNTVHCCRDYFETHHFKLLQQNTVAQMFRNVFNALNKKTFLQHVGWRDW